MPLHNTADFNTLDEYLRVLADISVCVFVCVCVCVCSVVVACLSRQLHCSDL